MGLGNDFTSILTLSHPTLTQSFTSGLNCLLESLDMQEEVFSLGSTSRFIANQLSNLPAARTRRKVKSIKVLYKLQFLIS